MSEDRPVYGKDAHVPPEIEGMPPGIKYIVGNEAAERFSFYGMKAILYVFMTEYLLDIEGNVSGMNEATATAWVHYFVAAVYLLPIFGAVIADWLFGKYSVIIYLSLVYCLGHGVMALVDFPGMTGVEPKWMLFLALGLISLGSGGIKPCVSAHVGDQFGKKNHHLVTKVYQLFYFSINLGSAVSTVLTPILLKYFGPGVAFGVPGVLMAIATFMFWLGRNQYVHVPPAKERFFEETFSKEGLRAIFNLLPLYAFVAMFWCLFDQTASTWVEQAKHMNLSTGLIGQIPYMPDELLPSQIQAANPMLVMILIPVFSFGLYPFLNKFFKLTPLRTVGIGMFLTVLPFAICAWVQQRIDDGQTPSIAWQFWAYLLLTAAEVMVSITVLEFSYTQAPKRMKSFIMGLNLLAVFAGNIFTAQVNDYRAVLQEQGNPLLEGANYYWFFTACMLGTSMLYVVYSYFYKGQTYIQGDEEHAEAVVEATSEH